MVIVKVMGGLGNQIFQYAAALRISIQLNSPVLLDVTFFDLDSFKGLFRLDKFDINFSYIKTEIPISTQGNKCKRISDFIFYKTPFFLTPIDSVINGDLIKYPLINILKLDPEKHYLLTGWLQREAYFSEVRKILSKTFWLRDKTKIDKSLEEKISLNNSVCVHVRRADMEKNSNFVIQQKTYYEKATKEILKLVPNPYFFVFSDEPEKARALLGDLGHPVIYVTQNSLSVGQYGTKGDYLDFELMRHCKHYIIANSTFSWWPAYLSENEFKKVILPLKWFNNHQLQKRFEKSGLIQQGWKLV